MPYQVLPGLVIIAGAFTLMGVGFGAVNKWQARNEQQSKLQLLTDWDRMMDERDRKLTARAKAAAEEAAGKH
ncbi:Membrane protein, partial [Globisporangium splendens]